LNNLQFVVETYQKLVVIPQKDIVVKPHTHPDYFF